VEVEHYVSEKTQLARFQQSREQERKRQLALVAEDQKHGRALEILPSRDMPRMRPAERRLAKHKVYI